MKKLIQKIVFGVAVGCFGFVAMLFIASAFAGGADAFMAQRSGSEWLQTAACFLFIGVGFSVPSLIYEKESLAIGLRVLLHMAAGTAVYLLTACFAGWIEADFGAAVLYILIALVTAAICWGIFMVTFKMQANKMNKRIREKQRS